MCLLILIQFNVLLFRPDRVDSFDRLVVVLSVLSPVANISVSSAKMTNVASSCCGVAQGHRRYKIEGTQTLSCDAPVSTGLTIVYPSSNWTLKSLSVIYDSRSYLYGIKFCS